MQLEPHPASGEIETPEVEEIRYRRLDRETLHSRLELDELGLLALYLWCTSDPLDGTSGWRLAELKSIEEKEDGTRWFSTISEADEGHQQGNTRAVPPVTHTNGVNGTNGINGHLAAANTADDDDDDDYWAAYDRTPGRTPAKRSPAPATNASVQPPTTTELEYFARYMAEVQPAMDPEDPSEEGLGPGESTLNGNELMRSLGRNQFEPAETTNIGPAGYDSSLPPQEETKTEESQPFEQFRQETELSHPRPRSSTSSSISGSVERLERRADTLAQAEVGIKQHISTDIKSLYRLARSAGIDRDEFERIVKTELDLLSMMDME